MSNANLTHAISGAAGGIISTIATYPLITISSRSQVSWDQHGKDSRPSLGLLGKFRQTIGIGGYSSLYAGIHSALFGVAVTNFVYFGVLQQVKSAYLLAAAKDGDDQHGIPKSILSVFESMMASTIAGAAAVVASNPIWVINTRCMCRAEREEEVQGGANERTDGMEEHTAKRQATSTKSAWDVALDIVRQDGIGALWHGLLPASILVINPVIQFAVFEQARGWAETFLVSCSDATATAACSADSGATGLGPAIVFSLSALAKLVATTITYPSLVLKSRAQFGHSRKTLAPLKQGLPRPQVPQILSHVPVIADLVEIIVIEGVSGLYKGYTAKILQSMLTAGILFAAKEELLHVSSEIVQLLQAYVTVLIPVSV